MLEQIIRHTGSERSRELLDSAIKELLFHFCNSGQVMGSEEADLFHLLYELRDNVDTAH